MRVERIASFGLVFGMLALMGLATADAEASLVSDIPKAINNALFDGASLFAARAVLTAGILMAAGMALAVMRMPVPGMFIILLAVLGALVAIGWADVAILVAGLFIAAGMFGKTIYEGIWGSSHKG